MWTFLNTLARAPSDSPPIASVSPKRTRVNAGPRAPMLPTRHQRCPEYDEHGGIRIDIPYPAGQTLSISASLPCAGAPGSAGALSEHTYSATLLITT
ncbi:hypothetical protein LAUMK191_00738 [Mycobacterium attenuatum]|uniref:Uncharacterized protein n=1 Tax=Mycobacterium attenuatum TaxID=2341086 RepID=A0A498PQU6_9MYCO|nr:hypothetical protein LAUMK136_00749 [Mycobacterium attenuatum]VBA47004.1 hypothetical protein LAUMK191_00738 [Mycobacterium attenuatum]